jgi:RecA/RadA recombinase
MKAIKLAKITENAEIKPVFDIQVEDTANYILKDGIISHNSGFIFASSIVVASKKRKLKEDADGKKTTEVNGIKADCKVVKSRFSKPFESVKINIPWDTGMDPYSGLFEMFEKSGSITKVGNRYRYVSKKTGEEFVEFRKNWTSDLYDMVMEEFSSADFKVVNVEVDDDE